MSLLLKNLCRKGALRNGTLMYRRGYAEAAVSDKLTLKLTLPHIKLMDSNNITQVNIPATSGDMGILANHVPSIEQLKPGTVQIIDASGNTTSYFVSSGFATMHPGNELTINAVEAFTLDQISHEAVRNKLAEAKAAQTSSNEEKTAEAAIQVEVLEALQAALK